MSRNRFFIYLLLALITTLSVMCAPKDPWTSDNPEYALTAFLSALNLGDHATVWEYLGPHTRQFLRDNYQQRQEALGHSADDPSPDQLMSGLFRVWTPSALEIDRLETVDQSENRANILVHSVFGEQTNVEMNRTEDRWTIELVDGRSHPSQPE